MVRGQFEKGVSFWFRSLVTHPCPVFFLGHTLNNECQVAFSKLALSGGPFKASQIKHISDCKTMPPPSIYIYIYTHVLYMYIYIYTSLSLYIYIYIIHVDICMYVCIYIYIYVYISVYKDRTRHLDPAFSIACAHTTTIQTIWSNILWFHIL